MAKKVHKIHSLPGDAPWQGGLPPAGSEEHPFAVRTLDRVLFLQRPLVLGHLRSIRLRHPDATGPEIAKVLERRYLATVTSGGAAVGATAVVPGIGTGITLALSGAETIGFLEATALFAQSMAEVHGISMNDPDRARALVLTLMMGSEGTKLLGQLSQQFSGSAKSNSAFWGELITTSLPQAAVAPVLDRMKSAFIHRLAAQGGASLLGKALPFGVGAAVGAGGNLLLGRRVVTGARKAFGPTPLELPADLTPRPGSRKLESAAASLVSRTAKTIATTGSVVSGVAFGAAKKLTTSKKKKKKPSDED